MMSMVFISKSKIQFESKSQRCLDPVALGRGCLSVSQRYNLKANHNAKAMAEQWAGGVYQ